MENIKLRIINWEHKKTKIKSITKIDITGGQHFTDIEEVWYAEAEEVPKDKIRILTSVVMEETINDNTERQ